MLVAFLAGALLLVVNSGLSVEMGADEGNPLFGVILFADLVLGLTALVLLPFRRRTPVTVGLIAGLIGGFSSFAVPAGLIILVSVAVRRRWRETAAVLTAWLVSIGVVEASGLTFSLTPAPASEVFFALVLGAFVLAGAVVTGMFIGNRRDLLVALQERAALAEADQQLRMEQARDHERTRIAREMHDGLGHRLSLIAMHASALRYRTDLGQDETASAANIVHESSRRALKELREVLGVLRDPQSPLGESPQPDAQELEALTALEPNVNLMLHVAPADIPSTTSRHIYRIVQECLTNARKHAPGCEVTVSLTGTAGENLNLSIVNALRPEKPQTLPTGGFGLVGIEERAKAVGGTMTVHTTADEHRIDVVLPWPAQ
jgi:signal transduction histidine kinase